eukprot:CAMPEP_0118862588 /NCGR_PEP_ID=MMETSP1163-20130328/7739_1 /TAXON_ID=124430 /ORGANISM="Phaeomonas parva, Strain CCMP2877" /LENGTH=178 /DNA_ID=CAMNT_0006796505 /DNA_START=110 /DNA_END=642 /DNA_ORIENTATION=-
MSCMRIEDAARILGVEPNDDLDTIKAAYRRLALRWHPDKCDKPEAKDKFQEISVAYTRLVSGDEEEEDDDEDAGGSDRYYNDVDEMRAFMNMFMDLVGVFGDGRGMGGPPGPGAPGDFMPGEISFEDIDGMHGMAFHMMFGGSMGGPGEWDSEDEDEDIYDEDDEEDSDHAEALPEHV